MTYIVLQLWCWLTKIVHIINPLAFPLGRYIAQKQAKLPCCPPQKGCPPELCTTVTHLSPLTTSSTISSIILVMLVAKRGIFATFFTSSSSEKFTANVLHSRQNQFFLNSKGLLSFSNAVCN